MAERVFCCFFFKFLLSFRLVNVQRCISFHVGNMENMLFLPIPRALPQPTPQAFSNIPTSLSEVKASIPPLHWLLPSSSDLTSPGTSCPPCSHLPQANNPCCFPSGSKSSNAAQRKTNQHLGSLLQARHFANISPSHNHARKLSLFYRRGHRGSDFICLAEVSTNIQPAVT